MYFSRLGVLALTALSLLSGCVCHPKTSLTEVPTSGAVAYRERIALPPSASLHVTLSSAGEKQPAATITVPFTGVPTPFQIKSALPVGTPCVLNATIMLDGEVLFATPEPTATTAGETNVSLWAQRVMPKQDAAPSPAQTTAAAQTPKNSLNNTTWQLAALNKTSVQAFAGQPLPHLVFTAETDTSGKISGSDGCNRLIGGYTLSSETIQFSTMGSTMMLCPAGEEQTRAFLSILGSVNKWHLQDSRLELSTSKGEVLLFEESTK